MIDALSRGDPSAWAIVALSVSLFVAIIIVRQQQWFIKGGTKALGTTIAVFTLIAILGTIGIALAPRIISANQAPKVVVNSW